MEEGEEEEKEDILSLDLTNCTDHDCDSQLTSAGQTCLSIC